jgi:hypothetical protein
MQYVRMNARETPPTIKSMSFMGSRIEITVIWEKPPTPVELTLTVTYFG